MTMQPRVGETIAGKYEIVGVLGEGGMGVVYEAIHRGLDQRVAIKALRDDFVSDRAYVARFQREAKIAARLRSEHTVRIFDVDVTPSGVPYMIMELLEGRDLADELYERGDIPLTEIVDWVVQIAAALQEAHHAGIVHRDLKPSNVFLCKANGKIVAKVLDFGISKAMGEAVGGITSTTTDKALGTPHYMSPEQVRGSKDLDGRSDVWALGVLMYRALSGLYPFEGDSATSLAVAIATEPATSLEVHRPELPFGLVKAIMRTLAKHPEDRFESVEELTIAIAPFGSGALPLPPRVSAARIPSRAEARRAKRHSGSAPTDTTRPDPHAATVAERDAQSVPSSAPGTLPSAGPRDAATRPNGKEASIGAQLLADGARREPPRRMAALWVALAVCAVGVPILLLLPFHRASVATVSDVPPMETASATPSVAASRPATPSSERGGELGKSTATTETASPGRSEPTAPPPATALQPAPVASAAVTATPVTPQPARTSPDVAQARASSAQATQSVTANPSAIPLHL